MPGQSRSQQKTVSRVMHEYKHGELKTRGDEKKVKNPKQAIAIALYEAGATNQENAETNKRNLHRAKAKEARGQTAQAAREGKALSKKALYAKARAQRIAGRSKMSKAELARAVH